MREPDPDDAAAIPVEGFPISAEAVQAWFVDRHGRLPGAPELTGILNAMAAREATAPAEAAGTEPIMCPPVEKPG